MKYRIPDLTENELELLKELVRGFAPSFDLQGRPVHSITNHTSVAYKLCEVIEIRENVNDGRH